METAQPTGSRGPDPPEWEISILDENLGPPDYPAMLDQTWWALRLFTSQANRAYEVAAHFRRLGCPSSWAHSRNHVRG